MEKTKEPKTTKATRSKKLTDSHAKALVELDRYKILVQSIEDYAIFMLDPKGIILTWNKGAQKNKGYKADEIIGKHFSTFYQKVDRDSNKPARELALAIARGRVEDEDWRVRKDGSVFWANVVITALYDNEGHHIGFAKVTRDLTERKYQEDTVRRSNVQLKRQQEELEKLNLSKDEFISLASHQLRTPATAIKQLLGLLLEGFHGEIPANISAVLTKAYVSNERQLNIVNSLLKVAQIDAGKVILNRTHTDMNTLLLNLKEEFQDTFSARAQTVKLDLPKGVPINCHIDSDYLRMAISNLIDNASKYTPNDGEVVIKLMQDSDTVAISVSDNGVGISKENVQKLFTKFVRIPNSMSQKVGGSGLGLYWLQRVVELHGGKVNVTSVLNEGTTFTLEIPRLKEAVA